MTCFFKKHLLPFLGTVLLCGLICFIILSPLIFATPPAQPANEEYNSAPYSREISTLLLLFSDLPVGFSLEIEPYSGVCRAFCFPLNIKNQSAKALTPSAAQKDIADFFDIDIDKYILSESNLLCNLIDSSGGIPIKLLYDTPSPTDNGYLPKNDEQIIIYGHSAVELIKSELNPSPERMEHYAEIVGKAAARHFATLSDSVFSMIIEQSKTDISYADYYDFSQKLNSDFKANYFTSPRGYWQENIFLAE